MPTHATYTGTHTIETDQGDFLLQVKFSAKTYGKNLGVQETVIHEDDYVYTLDGEEITPKELWRKFGTHSEYYTNMAINAAGEDY